jgi:hypothetical protein
MKGRTLLDVLHAQCGTSIEEQDEALDVASKCCQVQRSEAVLESHIERTILSFLLCFCCIYSVSALTQ